MLWRGVYTRILLLTLVITITPIWLTSTARTDHRHLLVHTEWGSNSEHVEVWRIWFWQNGFICMSNSGSVGEATDLHIRCVPSGGPSIGASDSVSVLPMNIQDWFPLGWTAWISLLSKGLSRVFSSTTVQKHQFFGAQLSLWSPSPAFNISQHQGLFQEVSSSHQVAKVLEFQLQHQSFQWIFRTDFL